MTRILVSAAVLISIASGGVLAQSAAPAMGSPPPPPLAGSAAPDSSTAGAPVALVNGYTEGQARSRIKAHGYTSVGPLAKDAKSVWRGNAMKDGKSVGVALNAQGNIVAP